jgi:hypothetical protein
MFTVITTGFDGHELESQSPTEATAFRSAADQLGPAGMNKVDKVRIRRPDGTEISHEQIVDWRKKNPPI